MSGSDLSSWNCTNDMTQTVRGWTNISFIFYFCFSHSSVSVAIFLSDKKWRKVVYCVGIAVNCMASASGWVCEMVKRSIALCLFAGWLLKKNRRAIRKPLEMLVKGSESQTFPASLKTHTRTYTPCTSVAATCRQAAAAAVAHGKPGCDFKDCFHCVIILSVSQCKLYIQLLWLFLFRERVEDRQVFKSTDP